MLVASDAQGRTAAVVLRSLLRGALRLGLGDELALRLWIPAVHRDLTHLLLGVDLDPDLPQVVGGREPHDGTPDGRADDQPLSIDAEMMPLLVRQSPQKDRVGDVALEAVLLGANRRLRAETVLLGNAGHDLLVVDCIERPRHR